MIRVILMIGILLLSACSASEDENGLTGAVVLCKEPFYKVNKWGSGCCIDQDGNGICDRDEDTNETQLTQRTIKMGNRS